MMDWIEALTRWLENTALSRSFIDNGAWAWPMSESLHFIGLCLLIGGIGLVDLRMLGVGKGIPFQAMHKLVYLAIGGFIINLCTGLLFVTGTPDQYFLNAAFQFKLGFLTIAGLNVAVFYTTVFQDLKRLGPEDVVPTRAQVMAGISLACWIGVICAGRLLTFYRP